MDLVTLDHVVIALGDQPNLPRKGQIFALVGHLKA